jgi:hypothetical protein
MADPVDDARAGGRSGHGQEQSRFSARTTTITAAPSSQRAGPPAQLFFRSAQGFASPGAPSARRGNGIGRLPDVFGNVEARAKTRRPVVAPRSLRSRAEITRRIVRLRIASSWTGLRRYGPFVGGCHRGSGATATRCGVPLVHVEDRAAAGPPSRVSTSADIRRQ